MQDNSPDKVYPFNVDLVFRGGLGRTLLICFFGLAVIPSILMGIISYEMADGHLKQDVYQTLRLTAQWKRRELQDFFDARSAAAVRQGQGMPPLAAIHDAVQRMLTTAGQLPDNMNIYLVNADLKPVAGTTAGLLVHGTTTVDTAPVRLWREQPALGPIRSTPPAPFAYSGPEGHPVIGTYARLHLGDTPFALIVEIDRDTAFSPLRHLRAIILTIVSLSAAAALVASIALARAIVGPLRDLSQSITMVAAEGIAPDIDVATDNEIGDLVAAFGGLIGQYQRIKQRIRNQSHFMSGLTRLHELIGGQQEMEELCLTMLEFLAEFLDLGQADFYILDNDGHLECTCRFPGHPDDEHRRVLSPGEGRAGQAALKMSVAAYRRETGKGSAEPVTDVESANLLVVPLVLRQTVKGVLELEKSGVFSRFDIRWLEAAAMILVVAVNAAAIRRQEKDLLEQTRRQVQKLKRREAALEANTRDLQAQREAFQASEEKLQFKQLELEAANAQMVKSTADLEKHMAILKQQKLDMQKQNAALEAAHRQLEQKARQLEVSSRYKSQFMANMSHELRTPLNSILLLSRLLLEDKEKTLSGRQAEFAKTIHLAGEDLLNLINEILDLAKVEAGKMEIALAPVQIRSIVEVMRTNFAPQAEQRGITFSIDVSPDVPEQLITDRRRIEQIVKNFLSNAFKFTARGTIRLEFAVSREVDICRRAGGAQMDGSLAVSVVDTGIGIPADKQALVFQAFQQVDGSTRRKYGGTGLGLSISRELARLLGGEITLESQSGQGSRFTLHLPIIRQADKPAFMDSKNRVPTTDLAAPPPMPDPTETATAGRDPLEDDRHTLTPEDKCILIIAADLHTTETIQAVAYQKAFKVLVAEQPQTGLHFADYYGPTAIFADLQQSGTDGWTIVRRIKANPNSRHIPVFTLSSRGDDFTAAQHGAAGHLNQPITTAKLKKAFDRIGQLRADDERAVLMLDPDRQHAARIGDIVGDPSIHITLTSTAADAGKFLNTQTVHAVIVNPTVDDTELNGFLDTLRYDPTPVFLVSATPAHKAVQAIIGRYGQTLSLRPIDTPDLLLPALAADLHLPVDAWDERHGNRLRAMDNQRSVLKGRKVLLVDDDMRTVFAVSSILEDQGAEVIAGKTGKESLDKLDSFPDIDLILMDVLIAGVDGYQAMREIRHRDRYKHLPLITLTAKAMRGDRSRCIAAGADDYLAKPVNLDKLTSMLRVWLDPRRKAPERIGAAMNSSS